MIYFIQEKKFFKGRIKIGYTAKDPLERFRIMQSQSPSALKMLFVIPGDKQDESNYHELFAAYRLHGEWFRYGLKLKLFIWGNQFITGGLFRPTMDLRRPKVRNLSNSPKSIPYLLLHGLLELILSKLVGRYPDCPDPFDYKDNEKFDKDYEKYETITSIMKNQKIRDWVRRTAWPDERPLSDFIKIDWSSFDQFEQEKPWLFEDSEFGGE